MFLFEPKSQRKLAIDEWDVQCSALKVRTIFISFSLIPTSFSQHSLLNSLSVSPPLYLFPLYHVYTFLQLVIHFRFVRAIHFYSADGKFGSKSHPLRGWPWNKLVTLNISKRKSQRGWKVPQLFVELNSREALGITADNTYAIYEHEHKNCTYFLIPAWRFTGYYCSKVNHILVYRDGFIWNYQCYTLAKFNYNRYSHYLEERYFVTGSFQGLPVRTPFNLGRFGL